MNPLAAFIREQMHNARIAALSAMPVEDLKSLWDRFPDDGSFCVDGHQLEHVHLVLNMKGHGDYCAV